MEDPVKILDGIGEQNIRLRAVINRYGKALGDKDERIAELEGQVKTLQDTANLKASRILKLLQENKDHVLNAETHKRASVQQISDLERQVDSLSKGKKDLPIIQAEPLIIDNRKFVPFPVDAVNEGLYVTDKAKAVTMGGTDYTEKVVLSEFKGLIYGGALTDSVVLNGNSFKRISGGGNDKKLLQDVGPHSILEHGGKYYVRWSVLTEKAADLGI